MLKTAVATAEVVCSDCWVCTDYDERDPHRCIERFFPKCRTCGHCWVHHDIEGIPIDYPQEPKKETFPFPLPGHPVPMPPYPNPTPSPYDPISYPRPTPRLPWKFPRFPRANPLVVYAEAA